MQKNLQISYYGYFTPFGGYGIANLNWVKHLRRLGVEVSVNPKFKPAEGTSEWNILSPEEREMFSAAFVPHRIGVVETNPFDFESNISKVKIANTMCESDRVSQSWPQKLNNMDYIVVPNEFCKNVFIESGVKRPITVIPHGVDTERFRFTKRAEDKPVFTFGILGYLDQTDRKGAFDVIRAFVSEFSPKEPAQLLIHSSDPLFAYYSRMTDPRIRVTTEKKNFESIYYFYKELDCFVFPSKAEGVGYPPREAMATGLPVILTNWSGLEDIALPEISYPLEPCGFEKRPNFIEQDGNWALIDIAELMGLMRHVYENREQARLKGQQASEYVGQACSWPVCAQKMKDFLYEL